MEYNLKNSESLYCTTVTYVILDIKYTLIKKKYLTEKAGSL